MKLTLSRPVRVGVYLLTALGSPVVAYLRLKGYIGDAEVALWSAEVSVAGTLAAVKAVFPDTEETS